MWYPKEPPPVWPILFLLMVAFGVRNCSAAPSYLNGDDSELRTPQEQQPTNNNNNQGDVVISNVLNLSDNSSADILARFNLSLANIEERKEFLSRDTKGELASSIINNNTSSTRS